MTLEDARTVIHDDKAALPDALRAAATLARAENSTLTDLLECLDRGGIVAELAALELYRRTKRNMPGHPASVITARGDWNDYLNPQFQDGSQGPYKAPSPSRPSSQSEPKHTALRLATGSQTAVKIISFTANHLADDDQVEGIKVELFKLIDSASRPKLLIDCTNLQHISSAAWGMLLFVRDAIKKKDGRMVLAGLSGPPMEVFKITKMDRLFILRPTREAALREF